MKRIAVFAGAIVMLAGFYGLAQGADAVGKDESAKAQQCPPAAAEPQAVMQRCMKMMQEAGMTPDMMRRCQVMMNTTIFMDSPCAVYAQAETLGLSDEQKKKLVEVENQARRQALAVLTAEQRAKMGDLPDKPMPLAQMCAKMMPMMQKTMGDMDKDSPMMMCPTMGMMQGGGAPKGSGSKPQGSGSKSDK